MNFAALPRIASAIMALLLAAHSSPGFSVDGIHPHPIALSGRLADGTAFSLAGLGGEVVVINFWATWCAPCRAEMPALDAYYRAHRAQNLRVIAIDMDDAAKAGAARAIASHFQFQAALVGDVRMPANLRPSRLPATLIFDRAGVLRFDSRRAPTGMIDAALLERIASPLIARAY